MLKKIHILLLTLLAAACFTVTAWADYDYIEQYGVMVTPNTEDGSLLITVKLEWTPLEELPYEGAKPMFVIADLSDSDTVLELVKATFDELPEPKRKNKKGV